MREKSFPLVVLLFFIAIPLLSGTAVGLLTRDSMEVYGALNRPFFAPPAIVFPIVWSILYTLMGISLYLIFKTEAGASSYLLFFVQLAVNLLWPFIFFNAQAYTEALYCLILLWVLVLLMIINFYRSSPLSAYLQIPYLLWLTFAGILNLYIVLQN